MNHRAAPGLVRDSIVSYLAADSASIAEIREAVAARIGDVPASSVRSYLNLNTPHLFERTGRGRYKLRPVNGNDSAQSASKPVHTIGRASLYHGSCFDWMRTCPPNSIHAIVTDPPYGLVEYTETEQAKLRQGRGWGLAYPALLRRPPARAPAPFYGVE